MQKDYKVLDGETLQDVSVKLYGSIEYQYLLLNDNNINISTNISGLTLKYNDSLISFVPNNVQANNVISTTQNSVIGVDGQSIFDVAIQTQGTMENVIELMDSNNIDFLTLNSVKSKLIIYYENKIKNRLIYNFMQNLGTSAGSTITHKVGGGSFNGSFNGSYDSTKGNNIIKSFNKSFSNSFK
jgi:hypothetical protein